MEGSANITEGGIGYTTMKLTLNSPITLFIELELNIFGY